MKILLIIISNLFLVALCTSEEITSPVYMGVGLAKPTQLIRSQLVELPKGVGFVLDSVKASGPAERAGLKVHDVVYMLEDQLLINEGQLMALLALRRDGEVVTVKYFRGGKAEETDLILESRDEILRPSGADSLKFPPIPGLPLHTIDRQERTATISDKQGIYTMMKQGEEIWLRVETLTGQLVFDGAVMNDAQIALVPKHCKDKLPILRRALVEITQVTRERRPRVRYVPPAK